MSELKKKANSRPVDLLVSCPYCEDRAEYISSSKEVYGRDYGPLYICKRCSAWVGCHKGTRKPLGRLADAELIAAKMAAHRAFDPKWRNGKLRRKEAYSWLADQLGIDTKACHIGMFDISLCRRVVEICSGS